MGSVAKALGALMLVGLVSLAGGCSRPPSQSAAGEGEESQRKRGGLLTIVDEPPSGPFGVPWEIAGQSILSAVPALETLLWMDWQGQLSPKLAERWEADPAARTITLYLRKGVKFHDGTEFAAAAVQFNLQNQLDAQLIPILQRVEVLDSHTVRLHLTRWDNSVFIYLSGTLMTMVSPTAIETKGVEWARYHPVGTGPFQFESYERDVHVTYKRFEGYWDQGKPYLDGVQIRYIRDPQTLKLAFQNQQVDVIGTRDIELASELAQAGYRVIQGMSGRNMLVLVPDSANPNSPLSDIRVRQAIWHAIDRQALVEARGFGLAQPTQQLAFPDSKAYLTDYQDEPYDVTRSKALLAEAGYPNGFATKLIAPPWVDRATVVAIQSQLADAGIDAQIETPEPTRYREYETKGWNGLLVTSYGYFSNYNRWVQFQYLGGFQPFASLQRPEGLEALWAESASTPTEDAAKVQNLHRLLLQHRTVIPLYISSTFYITQPYVHDTNHLAGPAWPWWTPAEAWLAR